MDFFGLRWVSLFSNCIQDKTFGPVDLRTGTRHSHIVPLPPPATGSGQMFAHAVHPPFPFPLADPEQMFAHAEIGAASGEIGGLNVLPHNADIQCLSSDMHSSNDLHRRRCGTGHR